MVDADYVVDWDVPLGRPVTYEVEVISGPSGPSRTLTAPVTVESDTGWIMDPLIPQTAVAILKPNEAAGRPAFAAAAMQSLEYAADVSLYKILGSDKPMALFGQRMQAAGVDFSMVTNAAEENSRLRKLFKSSAGLLVRLPADWQDSLPGSCFTAVAKIAERPTNAGRGGSLVVWDLAGDTVSAPAIKVLTATFTYGDVEILMETYGQKAASVIAAAAAAGEAPTYLFDMKKPIG